MNRTLSAPSRLLIGARRYSPIVLAALAACGGGGGGSTTPTPAPVACATNCVSGVAASGKAIGGATVTLTDSTGATRTAITGADGSYQIDTTGLVGPFLLKVAAAGGATFFSVSADSNAKTTVNLTQLSDLMVRTWYGAQGVDAAVAFSAPAANPAPPPAVLPTLASSVLSLVQVWLDRNGVPANYNPITSAFTTNGTGIDAVLDATALNPASPTTVTITITSGTMTQTTTLTLGGGSSTATTTTTDSTAGTSSSNVTTTTVLADAGASAALDLIKAGLAAFATTINTKGANLTAADVLPYVDPNMLDDGQTAAQFAANAVNSVAGSQVQLTVLNVNSLDLGAGTAEVRLLFAQTLGTQSGSETNVFHFKKIGNNWLIGGNGRAFRFDAQAQMSTNLGATSGWSTCSGGASGPAMVVNIDVRAPTGLLSGGTVSGGGTIWPNNKNTPTQCVSSTGLAPGGTSTDGGVTFDNFFMNTGAIAPANLPAAGSPITVSMTPTAGGAALAATAKLNAWTSDPTVITAPTNSTLGSMTFGTPMQVSWTLPTTYAIQNVQLGASIFDGDSSLPGTNSCFVDQAPLAKTATSGTITIPATCNGNPVVGINLNLSVNGVNGELSHSIFAIK
jgi:hypothetical protein